MASARVRAGAEHAREATAVVEVLQAGRDASRPDLPNRAFRAWRGLYAEHPRQIPVLLPRADVPQPAGAGRLSGARHRLSRFGGLRARLAHRDLPADGPSGAGRPDRWRELAGARAPG